MEPVDPIVPRISPRLRDALIADLAMEDLSVEGDRWTKLKLREPSDWTEHLGRQLGMTRSWGSDIHATLLVVVDGLDDLLKDWPPTSEHADCVRVAHEATKHLDPLDLYAMLLAGPAHWRKAKLPAELKVDRLPHEFQRMVEAALASEIRRVLDQWTRWDIRNLRQKRRDAIAAAAAAAAESPQWEQVVPHSGAERRRQRRSELDDIHKGNFGYEPPRNR
jgi:hypothetical protein